LARLLNVRYSFDSDTWPNTVRLGYLPPASPNVPWLNLDRKTKLPKGDYPIGRNAEVKPLVLQFLHMEHADLAELALGGG
jgi:hypothetical protein